MIYDMSIATLDDVEEIQQFCRDNFEPTWNFCAGAAPYPTADQMRFFIERGNYIVLTRNGESGDLLGYRIISNSGGAPLWGLASKSLTVEELAEGHAASTAYIWNLLGEVVEQTSVPEGSDENVAAFLNATDERAKEIYMEKYA